LERALAQHSQACEGLAELLRQAAAREPDKAAELGDAARRASLPVLAFVASTTAVDAVPECKRSLGDMALQQTQQLAKECIPHGAGLTTAAEVAAFLTRIGAVLAVALEGVASLRLAHRCVTGALPSHPSRANLASRLFDGHEGPTALEELRRELHGMLVHHRRLMDEVNEQFDELLTVVDPGQIERSCPAPRWSPLRHRALWNEFGRRYDELVERRRTNALGPMVRGILRALQGTMASPPVDLRCGVLAA
jgi:hypothetical protein